ncbi:MAG TPA: hypothetical protein VIL24_02415 [Clostridia bacterium]
MNKYLKYRKVNLNLIIISLAILAILIWALIATNYQFILATEEEIINFDETDALEDLLAAESFDIRDYPIDLNQKCRVINFVEFAYSYDPERQDLYGLYVYVYNPAVLDIVGDSALNKISIAIAYNDKHEPCDYQKFGLIFCDKSDGAYDRLFYKFKIDDPEKIILNNVNSNERRYDIAEIELLTHGKPNATAYTVGGSYRFTGFAKGFGIDPEAESTLESVVYELETIELQVKDTYYRLAKNASEAEQINTVYFAVPNEILEKYGRLQKIKCEWWEYKTKEIVVISDQTIYNALKPFIGVNIGGYDADIGYKLGFELDLGGDILVSWGYNYKNLAMKNCNRLAYLFYTGGKDIDKYILPDETLKQYIYDYDKSHASGYLPVKDGQISADLFEDSVDADRVKGYNITEIDAGDTFDLFGFDNSDFWGWWISMFYDIPSLDLENVTPIYDIKPIDLSGTNKQISDKLLVAESDVPEIIDYCNARNAENKTTFLFRFAVSDYVAYPLVIREDNIFETPHRNCAHYAQETVFFNFDIIQLTFCRDGIYHVIPVVQSPLDIVADITPPIYPEYEGLDWLMIIFFAIVAVLAVIILIKLLDRIWG